MEGDQLQIRDLNISDQGMYTCIARTSLDEDTATAFLTVLGMIAYLKFLKFLKLNYNFRFLCWFYCLFPDTPDAPMSLKISDQESRNVTLSWIPGSDHNSSVRGKTLNRMKHSIWIRV